MTIKEEAKTVKSEGPEDVTSEPLQSSKLSELTMTNSSRPPSNDFILTISGKRIPLREKLTASNIVIEDIAHSLALQNRFNGHTIHPYSVAQHCLNAVSCAIEFHQEKDPQVLLAILLHDSAEAYIGDIVRPLKYMLMDALKNAADQLECYDGGRSSSAYAECQAVLDFETNIELAIYNHFRVPHFDPRAAMLIREVDTQLCATESKYLCAASMPYGVFQYPLLKREDGRSNESFDSSSLQYYEPTFVASRFLKVFHELIGLRTSDEAKGAHHG